MYDIFEYLSQDDESPSKLTYQFRSINNWSGFVYFFPDIFFSLRYIWDIVDFMEIEGIILWLSTVIFFTYSYLFLIQKLFQVGK